MKVICNNHKVYTSLIGMIAMAPIIFYGCFGNGQDRNIISVPGAIDTTTVKKEIITLNHVFNILEVRPEAKTILPALSADEEAYRDTDAVPAVAGIVRKLPEPFVMQSSETTKHPAYPRKNDSFLYNDSLLVLTSKIQSQNASAIRVKFTKPGPFSHFINIYAYTAAGEIHGPYRSNMFYENELWSHMYFADELFIQIHIPVGLVEDNFSYILVEELSHIF